MKKFLKKIFLLSIPLLLWSILVVIIDPFNYFNLPNLINNKAKEANALAINTLMYRTLDFYTHPHPNIILGDSRIGILPKEAVRDISDATYKNLNINAAKLNEIFDLFYVANERQKLEHAVIGINFNMFNAFGYSNRVSNIKSILRNPLKYIYNRNVAQASYYVLRSLVTGKDISSVPPMTKEEFWEWNIKVKAAQWYGKYKFPKSLYKELVRLDSFALQNDIALTFIIVPHHKSFHDRLIEFGLAEAEQEFKAIMSSLSARVIDYDYPNAITNDKDNFKDPIHCKKTIGRLIVHEVWKEDYTIGKLLTGTNAP